MSTKKKVVVSTTPRTTPSTTRTKSAPASTASSVLIFGRPNYLIMLVGLALIALGLVLMSGGAMPDPNTWDESLIYSRRRTVIGPLVIIIGLVVEIVAIFKNVGQTASAEADPA